MIIKNPTNLNLAVTIKGVDYVLGAQSERKGIPAEHAEYWKVHLHNFIEVVPEDHDAEITSKSAKKEPKVEEEVVETPVAEEEAEEPEPEVEVKDEKPKGKGKKNK